MTERLSKRLIYGSDDERYCQTDRTWSGNDFLLFQWGNVREKNRIKIEEAIEELHYEVNEVARGLKTNATKTVVVVIPELNNVFCAEIISGMEDILRSHGYAAIVCDCRTDKKLEKEAVDFLTRKRVDGIINMPVDMTGAHLNEFQKTGKPIVLIDRDPGNILRLCAGG